jgi:hypothetical protein
MIKEIEDHGDECTWHDPKTGERCRKPAVMGSAKTAVCEEHLVIIRRLQTAPGD